jgi:hypothetical protein
MKLFSTARNFVAASVAAAAIAFTPQAGAIPVALELQLLVDVSGSVDTNEFNLQKAGYVQAFQSAAVQAAIAATAGGAIAVQLIYWSGAGSQQVALGWTLINSAAAANAFAAAINGTARPFTGNTAPGSAINFAMSAGVNFSSNDFDSLRQVIDVSGDGAQNEGANTAAARDAALAAGIDQINGLVILGEAGLEAWYNANVKGGAGAFVEVANDFTDFAGAIERKIIRETVGAPEPGTLFLLSIAMVGLGAGLRRRQA